jgi:maleate isomerase
LAAYGYRARIGYTCPIFVAEIFPQDFYRMVPEGVSLLISTMSVWEGTPDEMQLSAQQSMRAIREMAKSGANVVVFGGVPVNFALGATSLEDAMQELQGELGIPVSASLLCQNAALRAIGAKRVVVLRSAAGTNTQHMQEVEGLGCTILEHASVGRNMRTATRLTAEETLEIARELLKRNPTADTLHCPSPHWPIAANIDPLEKEFGVNVITAGQANIWRTLRLAGINDSIYGHGRLLREF